MAAPSLFLYGIHPVLAALHNPQRQLKKIYITSKTLQSLRDKIPALTVPLQVVEPRLLETLCPRDAVHQGIVLETLSLPVPTLEEVCANPEAADMIVVLDQVTDPQNVGAVLRSCAAFGAKALLVTEHHHPNLTGTLAKAASGALEYVPLIPVTNLARSLEIVKKNGWWCYGFDEKADQVLGHTSLTGPTLLLFGAEGAGLRSLTRTSCDMLLRLPTQPHFPTLNVSNTVAVALFSHHCEYKNRHPEASKRP